MKYLSAGPSELVKILLKIYPIKIEYNKADNFAIIMEKKFQIRI